MFVDVNFKLERSTPLILFQVPKQGTCDYCQKFLANMTGSELLSRKAIQGEQLAGRKVVSL